MPSEFDFDPQNSNLKIGIEVEYPAVSDGKKFVSRGRGTNSLERTLRQESWPLGGRTTYDGTVGLEVVSDVLDLADAPMWYAEVIDFIEAEYGTEYQPVGLMESGNTAGTHIHLSPLTRRQAEELYEISRTPWAKVLWCSSIATENEEAAWPVFRGGQYCRMNLGAEHYDCVNERGPDHYEWRLPEPMIPEHLHILVKFLRLFEQDTEAAIEYAQEVLDDGDDRITAIRRAEQSGIDFEEAPLIRREQPSVDPENFFETVRNTWGAPEIYHIEYDDEHFYVFDSRLNGTFRVGGDEFSVRSVLYADSLNPVENEELANDIRRAFNRHNVEGARETEATEELKKIVKKKKS